MRATMLAALLAANIAHVAAFAPVMMCAPSEGASVPKKAWSPPASRRAIDEARNADGKLGAANPEGLAAKDMSRRGAFGAMFKGAAAVAVGDAVIGGLVAEEGAAVAGGLAAEEAGALGGAAAVGEGAAMLRNGQVVMGEMEKKLFGNAISRGLL